MSTSTILTKADTKALWYAVDDMVFMLYGMQSDPPLPEGVRAEQRLKIIAAKRALRKVNAIRKAQRAVKESGK